MCFVLSATFGDTHHRSAPQTTNSIGSESIVGYNYFHSMAPNVWFSGDESAPCELLVVRSRSQISASIALQ